MVGLMLWSEQRSRRPETVKLLQVPFLCVRLPREEQGLPRRLRRAARQLRRQGIREVVAPRELALPLPEGLSAVSTVPLQQLTAADRLALALGERRGSTVAVAAEELTAEVVRTVTKLCLRYRYVLLRVPRGGAQLAASLRREYGAAVQLDPTPEQASGAEAAVLFAPAPEWACPVCLRLNEEGALPPLILPPALEEQLPEEADRGQLLSALYRAGVLRREWLRVGEKDPSQVENFKKVPPFPPGIALDNSEVRPYNTKL